MKKVVSVLFLLCSIILILNSCKKREDLREELSTSVLPIKNGYYQYYESSDGQPLLRPYPGKGVFLEIKLVTSLTEENPKSSIILRRNGNLSKLKGFDEFIKKHSDCELLVHPEYATLQFDLKTKEFILKNRPSLEDGIRLNDISSVRYDPQKDIFWVHLKTALQDKGAKTTLYKLKRVIKSVYPYDDYVY